MATKAQRAQLVLKERRNQKKFVRASNQSGLSRDTATIVQYTNVTGSNQSGSSWDRLRGAIIVLVCTVCMEMTFLVVLFYILKSIYYIGVLHTLMSLKAPCSG